MNISFTNFIKVYRKSEFDDNSGNARYCIESEEEIYLLRELSDRYGEETSLTLLEGQSTLKIGQYTALQFGVPSPSFGRLFNDFEAFIKSEISLFNQPLSSLSPYYVKAEKTASFDEHKPQKFLNYEQIKELLSLLKDMSSYTDSVNKKLIFFSKTTLALSVDLNKQIKEYIQVIETVDSETRTVISSFCSWLNDEKTSKHLGEIKSILAFVLTDIFPTGANLIDLLNNIGHINQSVRGQYALYLENFSYGKFVKKLEENTEKFVSKINDTINKVLPQFLGLPFLTAIPTALKSGDNWLVYVALMAYCAMCFVGLRNQKLILEHLRQDVETFESRGKIPEKLVEQWREDKHKINKLLTNQMYLSWVLTVSLCFFFLYGVIKFACSLNAFDLSKVCDYVYQLILSESSNLKAR